MKKFKYKCSGGSGDYYTGIIEASTLCAAAEKLEKIYHSVLYLEKLNS